MAAGPVVERTVVKIRSDQLDIDFLQFGGNPVLPVFDVLDSLTSHQQSP